MGFEPGGRADKLGNRYEGRWIAKQFLRILNEEIHSVTIEAVGDDERGVDLWVEHKSGLREAHQCKARNGSKESWSIADLNIRGILDHICFQLERSQNCNFLFVSGVHAALLNDICFSARNSNSNPEDFYKHQVDCSGDRRKLVRQFCDYLKLNVDDSEDRKKAYDYFRRIRIELYPDTQDSYNDLLTMSGFLLKGEPEKVISTLLGYSDSHDHYGKPIYADDLLKYLKSQGIHSKNLVQDTRVLPAIECLKREFNDSIYPGLIGNTLIHREETDKCLEAINNEGIIILHGAAGSGKSGALYELTKKLSAKNIPFLPVRLDRRMPANTAVHFGDSMGLPDSPANCLVAVSGVRQCVLILDQLDAVRWTSKHSTNALDVCKELVSQVISFRRDGKNISVVLACRTFDMEHDPEIRNWFDSKNEEKKAIKLEVQPLPDFTVRKIVGKMFDSMSSRQQIILSNPQNLSMWSELHKLNKLHSPSFRSSTELMKQFWAFRRSQLEKIGVTAEDVNFIINKLVDWLGKKGRISAPGRIISDCSRKSIDALKSHSIIQEQNSRISFCHQNYLDFLIAERLLREIDDGGSILEWLGPREKQTLFRREQLRQALALLSDESSGNFLETVKEILHSGEVRFHLKHLVLELIWQIENIPACLADYCINLLGDVYWEKHIIETVFLGHVSFIRILIERDIIAKWLYSGDSTSISLALELLRSVNNKIPDRVTGILKPFMKEGDEWQERILKTICWQITGDSESMFEIRLQLARNGVISNFVDWKSLCSRYPDRALRLIEAVISTWDIPGGSDNPYQRKSRLEQWYEHDWHELSKVADRYPEKTWEMFVPQIVRLTSVKASTYDKRVMTWQRKRIGEDSRDSIEIAQGVVELSIIAGIKLAKKSPEFILKSAKPLEKNTAPIVQEILMEVYAHLTGKYADVGINLLLSDIRNFRPGRGADEPEWMPAVRLIKALSPHCSENLFLKLEQSIINYHSPNEKELAKRCLDLRKKGYYHHYWGQTQFFLLPALSVNRAGRKTKDLISVLKRKFDSYPEDYFLQYHSTGVLSIVSKIDSKSTQINDREWLKIIGNRNVPEECLGSDIVQVSEDKAVQSSIWQFSRNLREMARRFPERFGRLAIRFPKDTHHKYISAIFDALALTGPPPEVASDETFTWKQASIDTVWAVWDRFCEMSSRDVAMSFCRLIENRANEEWPTIAIEKLLYIAINHPDPEPGKLNLTNGGDDFFTDGKGVDILLQNSINCVRGVAAGAIGDLIWQHPHRLDKLKPGIESLISDHHPAVRIANIKILLPITNINRTLAVTWFCKLSKRDSRVPASHYAVRFFNATILEFYNQLKPIVLGMLTSSLEEVSTHGAELSTAYFLFHGLFEEEVESCRVGTAAQRKGVAKTAASFINDVRYAEKCQELLIPLLNDPDSEVREKTVFRPGNSFFSSPKSIALVKIIVQSKAFTDSSFNIIHSLRDYKGNLILCHSIILEICQVITTSLLEKSKDYQTGFPADLEEIPPLLLRLYEQANEGNSEVANKCLDAWDTLYEHRVGFTRSLTKSIEK